MRAGRRHHRAQGSGGHDEREQAERHVKAAEQSGRGEDAGWPGKAALAALQAVAPDSWGSRPIISGEPLRDDGQCTTTIANEAP